MYIPCISYRNKNINTVLGEGNAISEYAKAIKSDDAFDAENYVVLDIETTGLNPYKDKIIEIAAVRGNHGDVLDTFHTLIDPGIHIPSNIIELTGLTDADVAGQPTFSDIVDELSSFIGDDPVVGHNVGFDLKFITNAMKKEGFSGYINGIDTVTFAKAMFPGRENYKLETLIREFDLKDGSQAHRAMSDVECTHKLFTLCCQKMYTVKRYESNAENLSRKVASNKKDNVARCPKCGSTSLTGNKKGYGIGKGVVGAVALGPLGLIAGNIGKNKIKVTCLNCGHQWKQ